MSDATTRAELRAELSKLVEQESSIDSELRQFFSLLAGGDGGSVGAGSSSLEGGVTATVKLSFDSADLTNNVKKIEQFAPCFEAMVQDSKKLAVQVEDCRALSDRLSVIVRRLDLMQIRAQQALACTEDIINLKECKLRLQSAIDEHNLPLAVSFIRQVHDIDAQAAKASDDFASLQEAEASVRELVQKELAKAMKENNLNGVMALCPLLQTLGLEVEARDSFLEFIEATVFIGVTADATSVDGATTDAATGYAQALSNVFNSTYIILQQYLPMVIQGMESSLGDVYFIRRLHAKCEQEAGLVLKRYMKYRNVKEVIASIRPGGSGMGGGGSGSGGNKQASTADMHAVLDELALLIQYCCLYSKYLKNLCVGAESRKRISSSSSSSSNSSRNRSSSSSSGSGSGGGGEEGVGLSGAASAPVVVFTGTTEFEKMVDELINRYYMEGEKFLMKQGVSSAIPRGVDQHLESSSGRGVGSGLDECFFVLQRCGHRAIATNNIHAACAVLHVVSDLLASDLLSKATEAVTGAAGKVTSILQEHMAKYIRSNSSGAGGASGTGESSGEAASATLSKGLKSAISLASAITSGGSSSSNSNSSSSGGGGGDDNDDDEDDPYGVANALECFNMVEMCARYTERLARDVSSAGESVFAPAAGSTGAASSSSSSGLKKKVYSPEQDKLRLCKEDFDAARLSFTQALRHGSERLSSAAQLIMKDVLLNTLGRTGPLGGVKFDLPDERFDAQPALSLLPRILVMPFETLVNICTCCLSETNKDMVVGMLADACCERLEHYITQNSFRFAGALKFEECVRALSAMFTRCSTSPIRGKFSRLREVMLVLTSDVSSSNVIAESFTQLTLAEAQAFAALRIDNAE